MTDERWHQVERVYLAVLARDESLNDLVAEGTPQADAAQVAFHDAGDAFNGVNQAYGLTSTAKNANSLARSACDVNWEISVMPASACHRASRV